MLIDLLTYICLDKTALISALGFIKKTVINKVIASVYSSFGCCMACRGAAVRVRLAPLIFLVISKDFKDVFVKA